MCLEIYPNYKKSFLFPPRLEDFVPPNHPARFIREFVEALDLEEMGFKVRESSAGRPNYSSDMMFKIWLYGYFMNIRSSRKLEKACMENLGLVWLTGMNYPDHNSIWRFFNANHESIKQIFKKSVRLAAEMELIGMILNAVDGTKVQADVSCGKALHRDTIEKLLKKIDKSIDELNAQIRENEETEIGLEYKLPEELAQQLHDKEEFRKRVTEKLAELDREELDHMSKTDPDARMMKNGKRVDFSYNAQAAVDDQTGIIVGSDVVSEESDNHQLNDVLDGVEEVTGQTAEETVADGGYFSGEELKTAEEKEREVLINLTENSIDHVIDSSSEFHHSNFKYNAESDTYDCPRGGTLHFQRIKRNRRKNYEVRVYHCKSYKTCPFRDQCSQNKRGRTIEVSPYREEVERHRKKQSNPDKKAILSRRKVIVEPVFGIIKHNNGFRRWTVRGIKKVKVQWSLICSAFNLKKLYSCWLQAKG